VSEPREGPVVPLAEIGLRFSLFPVQVLAKAVHLAGVPFAATRTLAAGWAVAPKDAQAEVLVEEQALRGKSAALVARLEPVAAPHGIAVVALGRSGFEPTDGLPSTVHCSAPRRIVSHSREPVFVGQVRARAVEQTLRLSHAELARFQALD